MLLQVITTPLLIYKEILQGCPVTPELRSNHDLGYQFEDMDSENKASIQNKKKTDKMFSVIRT